MANPPLKECDKCPRYCVDFNLSILCEDPRKISVLIPKLNKILANQKRVNIIVTTEKNLSLIIPYVDETFEKYCDEKDYKMVLISSFEENQYDSAIECMMDSTGGGLLVFGSEKFMKYITERFYELANKYKGNEYHNLFKKIKIKFIKDIPEVKIPRYEQQRFF